VGRKEEHFKTNNFPPNGRKINTSRLEISKINISDREDFWEKGGPNKSLAKEKPAT